jgi:hypothetical protein
MSFAHIEFTGRNGLSRSLKARFTETHFLYTFAVLAAISGFMTSMNVLMPVFAGHFKVALSFSSIAQILFFASTSYLAWILSRTSSIQVHLHGEHLIYERANQEAVSISFADIQSISFKHSRGVKGFSILMSSGMSYHFPIHLERLDYVLDTLHFHRSDLTQNAEFFEFRNKALALDHVLAHNKSYLARANVKAILFYFMYPLLLIHSYKRIQSDPKLVSRDLEYEKKMETLCHKINIGLGLVALASVVLLKWHL